MIKVVAIDDHEVVLKGISETLATTPNMRVVGTALNGTDAVHISKNLKPNIVLIDLHMPGIDGIRTAKRILKDSPKIKVIIFTGISKIELIERAKYIGAKGYIIKCLSPDAVVNAILEVYEGVSDFIYRGYQIQSRKKISKINHALFSQLTEKEEAVLDLILNGYTVQEISKITMKDERSIRNRRESIRKKLGIDNDAQLILMAIQAGYFHNI